jgi:hypothetical protein
MQSFFNVGQLIDGHPVFVRMQHFPMIDNLDRTLTISWGGGRNFNDVAVDVYYHSRFGEAPKGQVNWSAMGSQDPSLARVYGALLQIAADWGDTMPEIPETAKQEQPDDIDAHFKANGTDKQ